MKSLHVVALFGALTVVAVACSSSSTGGNGSTCTGSSCSDASSPTLPADGGSTTNSSGGDGSAPEDAGGGSDASVVHPDAGVPDPTGLGPYTYAEMDGKFTSTNDNSTQVAVHVAYPTGGGSAKGPYPVVLFAPGFLVDQSEYYSYLQHAASFGYVAMTVNYAPSIQLSNYVANTTDVLGGLTWLGAQTAAPLKGLANLNLVGASGHSLGGKIAILAAAKDTRIKAAVTFDAVDGSGPCAGANLCPNASSVLPLPIPTGFLGETLDGNPAPGFSQACAPTANNFTTIYAPAGSPSLEVTLLGAGHVSFLDNVSACGEFCSFCNSPKVPQAQELTIAHSYLIAFYERYLRNDTTYDTYLTGPLAQSFFVSTAEATIVSK